MTLPGVEVLKQDAAPPRGPILSLSTVFLIVETEQGPVGSVTSVRSLRAFEAVYGARTAASAAAHDWLDAHFREGGGRVYVSRRVGATPVKATVNLSDGSANTLTVTAKEYGAGGNRLNAAIIAGDAGGEFKIVITDDLDSSVTETSPSFATGILAAADVTGWSSLVDIVDISGSALDPATVSATSLSGGADDHAGITGTQTSAALVPFVAGLGPGHVVLASGTDTTSQLLVAAHCDAMNRIATLDTAATSNTATLTAQADTLKAGGFGDSIDLVTGRLSIPGLTASTSRTVPASVLRCAAQARNDAAGTSPNQPAAGRWGQAQYCTATDVAWTDTERETLNDAGVNVVREVDGDLRLYGARTLADLDDDPAGIRLGSARLRMALAEVARAEGESVAFEEVTEISMGNLEGQIVASAKPFTASLYLFTVDVQLVDGDNVGEYILETAIEFQARPDAERVRLVVTRSIKES